MKKYLSVPVAAVMLLSSSPAWPFAVSNGMDLYGGLETAWSSDLLRRYSQSIHPDNATYSDGTTTPVTPTGYTFNNEGVTVSLQGKGLSGTLTSFATPTGNIEGSVYHFQANLTTPAVGYYGMGISGGIQARTYISGASSSTLYYGLRLSDASSGGASDSLYAVVNDAPTINSVVSSFSQDYFGTTNLKVWNGGSAVNSGNGSGFITMQFNPGSMNPSNSTLPGGTSKFDMWVTFSSTPITAMPPLSSVPVPGAIWLFASALAGFIGFNRRNIMQ